jgi:hypothetical protein
VRPRRGHRGSDAGLSARIDAARRPAAPSETTGPAPGGNATLQDSASQPKTPVQTLDDRTDDPLDSGSSDEDSNDEVMQDDLWDEDSGDDD